MSLIRMRERFARHLKVGLWIIAGLFFISCFVGYGSSIYNRAVSPEETTVARVDGDEISRDEFDHVFRRYTEDSPRPVTAMQLPFMKSQILDQLIDHLVRLRAARQERIRVSRDEIQAEKDRIVQEQLQQLRQSLGQGKILSDEEFEKQVKARYSRTLAVLKKDIEEGLPDEAVREQLMLKKLEDEIKVQVLVPTEADLKEKYTEVRARHILIDTGSRSEEQAKKRAEEVLAKVKAGGSFNQLAKDYSDDTTNKDKGGDLGYFRKGTMAPEFEKMAFSLSPGKLSDPVKTSFGYHIIKVEDKRVQYPKDFEKDKKKEMEALHTENQNKAVGAFYTALKANTKIDILDPELKAARTLNEALNASMRGQKDVADKKQEEAIAQLREALDKMGDDPGIYCAMATIYQQKKDTKKAISMLNKALLSTDSADIHMALASLYEQTKQKDQAIKHYKMASDAAYDDFMAHIQLQTAFEKLGRKDLAAKEKEWLDKYQQQMLERQKDLEENAKKAAQAQKAPAASGKKSEETSSANAPASESKAQTGTGAAAPPDQPSSGPASTTTPPSGSPGPATAPAGGASKGR